MKGTHMKGRIRWVALPIVMISALFGMSLIGTTGVEANHPVLVEGNCDSPVPGTTIVTAGTCGDFDGDGRIGTAEDTDGADRIFGTLMAALGPGTGAAAGTGANFNGLVKIVTSGRFAENIFIGTNNLCGPGCPGVADPGNVTLEAAPGVAAIIDAVLQGDPAGGNTSRQASNGIRVSYTNPGRRVTLRNLMVRNWDFGIDISGTSNVTIDNCRIENNNNGGIRIGGDARMVVTDSQVIATGFRVPTIAPTTAFGIRIDAPAQARIANTTVSYGVNAGIYNTGAASNVTLYKVSSFFNGAPIAGAVTTCTDAALCQ